MRKEEVYLDLTKLTKEQLINVAESVKDEMFSYSHEGLIKGSRGCYEYLHKVDDLWARSSDKGSRKEITYDEFINLFQDKEVEEEIKLEKDTHYNIVLNIGDTFEYEGFICEVKEKIEEKKWYRVDSDLDAYYIKLSKDEVLWRRAEELTVKEITDYHFINLLEEHSK